FILLISYLLFSFFFFFNDPATTVIYTLSLHDALPIFLTLQVFDRERIVSLVDRDDRVATGDRGIRQHDVGAERPANEILSGIKGDRKSTRLNSSHRTISYAVFCLKKKKKKKHNIYTNT